MAKQNEHSVFHSTYSIDGNNDSFEFNAVLGEYFELLDCEGSVDVAEFADRYPKFASRIHEFVENEADAQLRIRELAQPNAHHESEGKEMSPPATKFANYELVEWIDQGGMGEVYKARQSPMGRFVAIKFIRSDRDSSDEQTQRFLYEAEVTGKLRHPNIVSIFECGQVDGRMFYSMDFISGRDLRRIKETGTIEPKDAARIMLKSARAIGYAHDCAVLHRDIKPSNILVDDRLGEPHITDFGLARPIDHDLGFTKTGQMVGTPAYMSPEQTSPEQTRITVASDVYSLGATLYYLLTGRPPFSGADAVEVFQLIRNQPAAPPSRLNSLVDRDLETICLKCLEKHPRKRYGSAHALGEDLDRYLVGRPISARRLSFVEHSRRLIRMYPYQSALAAIIAILAIVGPILAFYFNSLRIEAAVQRQFAEAAEENTRSTRNALLNALSAPRPQLKGHQVRFSDVLDDIVRQLEIDLDDKPVYLAEIFLALSGTHRSLGNAERAVELARGATEIFEGVYGPNSIQKLRALSNLGVQLIDYDDGKEAVEVNRQVVKQFSRVYPSNHIEFLKQQNNLGGALISVGRAREALPILKDAVQVARVTFGDANLDVANLMATLALAWHELKHYDRAYELQKIVLATRLALLPPDDHRVTMAKGSVMLSEIYLGKVDNTIATSHELRQTLREKSSPNSLAAVAAINGLAASYQNQGDWVRAAQLYGQSVSVLRGSIGDTHIKTLGEIHNLGYVEERIGNFEIAAKLYGEAAEGRQSTLGPKHPETLNSLFNLACMYQAMYQVGAAIPVFEETLAGRRMVLPPAHPDVLMSYALLATSYVQNESFEQAAKLCSNWLKSEEQLGAPDMFRLVALRVFWAESLAELNRSAEAREHLQEADKVLSNIKKSAPQLVADAESVRGWLLFKSQKLKEAEESLLHGFSELREHKNRLPRFLQHRYGRAIQRIVKFYELTDREAESTMWKRRLTDLLGEKQR